MGNVFPNIANETIINGKINVRDQMVSKYVTWKSEWMSSSFVLKACYVVVLSHKCLLPSMISGGSMTFLGIILSLTQSLFMYLSHNHYYFLSRYELPLHIQKDGSVLLKVHI